MTITTVTFEREREAQRLSANRHASSIRQPSLNVHQALAAEAPLGMHHDQARSGASAREKASDAPEPPRLPLVYCPECGMPAWVEWRHEAGSDAAAHVKVRCFARHWFLLPEDRLTAA